MKTINKKFWKNKRVALTGHTGFKGSWMALWLNKLGASVFGYALEPPTDPSLYDLCGINELVNSTIDDVRNPAGLHSFMQATTPEIVIHMAAQPLVLASYDDPADTYATNVMGTVNVLDAVRACPDVKAVVVVTTDKCYQNNEWAWGYRETDTLGGRDPYANSKACAELVTHSFRESFFNGQSHGAAVATARAGNVIGGGDWAEYRLIPDCVRAILDKQTIELRSPHAIRPWQHVLESLSGYLLLAEQLCLQGREFADAWNFGPDSSDEQTVEDVVTLLCELWGKDAAFEVHPNDHQHEASYLKLDSSKARSLLHWHPRWNVREALTRVVEWTHAYQNNDQLRETCFQQITHYEETYE
jgi:CDP-glucose 4,6-dehydratase